MEAQSRSPISIHILLSRTSNPFFHLTSIHPHGQNLICKGKLLVDEMTLWAWVQDDSHGFSGFASRDDGTYSMKKVLIWSSEQLGNENLVFRYLTIFMLLI